MIITPRNEQWHPRPDEVHPIPTPDELDLLATTLSVLTGRAEGLWSSMQPDSLRVDSVTESVTDDV